MEHECFKAASTDVSSLSSKNNSTTKSYKLRENTTYFCITFNITNFYLSPPHPPTPMFNPVKKNENHAYIVKKA